MARLPDPRAPRTGPSLLEPTLQAAASRGLLADVQTMHLDKGYDSHLTIERCHTLGVSDVVCDKRRKDGPKVTKRRRNTDRFTTQRLGQIALAVTLILTVKLITWAKRWND